MIASKQSPILVRALAAPAYLLSLSYAVKISDAADSTTIEKESIVALSV